MKRTGPFIYVICVLVVWVALLGAVYQKGKMPGGLIYAEIHPETIRFLNDLSDKLDIFIRFDPDVRPKDWKNTLNYGEDPATGLKKIEDDNFIIYFSDTERESERAVKILGWAKEAISPLTGLMGSYPYPAVLNNRKLPVYLSRNSTQYDEIASMLLGVRTSMKGTWGVYISSYSQMGCLTKGIVISPDTWVNDKSAKETLWHEMNHFVYFSTLEYDKVVRPYMWVYEGLAEYFSKEERKLTRQQIEKCLTYSLERNFPENLANYWGGESVFRFMENHYNVNRVETFIKYTYSTTVEQSIGLTFQSDINEFESIWKRALVN